MPKPNQRWRLKKTLERPHSFKVLESEDVPYVGVAYRRGVLKGVLPDDLSADEFKAEFVGLILQRYDAAWTLLAETNKGIVPVGMAVGFWLHRQAPRPVMILDAFVWFPWASPRNKIESAIGFLDVAKKDIPMLGFARAKDKAFMDVIARHGIVTRVGTSRRLFGDEPATVWETR